jgi:integrase
MSEAKNMPWQLLMHTWRLEVAGGIEKLTALKVARLSKPGRYGDGKGLCLQITKKGAKSWIFRFERDGKERFMGLGALHTVSLADAREKARMARLSLADGVDPLAKRDVEVATKKAEQASNLDFDKCAAQYIESREAEWKNAKHRQQWERSLQTHVSPHFGRMHVRRIDTPLVLKALEPIWRTKTETASRIRERIERVLSWATTRGYREGENPARWSGHLEELLPKPAKLKKVQHHPALPFAEAGSFFRALAAQQGTAARALEFTILTACRTSEVLGAQWDEVDLEGRVWTVPPERMKAGKPHRVPLVPATVAILKRQVRQHRQYVFPGSKEDSPLSTMAMLTVLRRMARRDLTVHGFRSTFRDWAAERTEYPSEMAEISLAHTVGSAVENAYRRSDLFERRRRLMQDWAAWCTDRSPVAGAEPACDKLGAAAT